MKRISVQIKWLLAVCLAVASLSVQAAQEAGKVLFSRGVVSIIGANDSARGARAGLPVFEGERIVTGRNSVVQIHMTDGTLLGLRGNSDYLIERQRYQQEETSVEADDESLYDQAGELFSGWMRMVTGAIGKSNPTSVRQTTSVATIGIRGTVYQVIHIPPDGLPGFPDTEPGTYLMLEEGEVEIAGEGGSRIVRPGDVVFVPFGGGKPRPVPNKRHLFQTEDGDDAAPGSEDEEDADRFGDADNEVDPQLNQTVDGQLEQVFGSVQQLDPRTFGMGLVSPGGDGTVFGGAYAADNEVVFARDSNGNYYPVSASVFVLSQGASATYQLVGLDERPSDTGTYELFDSSGNLLGQAWWGYFDSSQYNFTDSVVSGAGLGDWHWVIASDVWADPEGLYTSFLTGSISYDLVGGTRLRGNLGSVFDFTGGSATLFLDKREMSFGLDFNDGGGNVSLSGAGDLKSYFETGIPIGDGFGLWTGNIFGGLFTPELAGLLATLHLNDSVEDFQASLVFEQVGGGLTPGAPPLPQAGMVGGYSYNSSVELAVATGLYHTSVGDFGGALAPTYSKHYSWLYSGDFITYLKVPTAVPGNTGSTVIAGGASEVHWGVWGSSALEVEDPTEITGPTDGPMTYMVASNAREELEADAFFLAQPAGSFEYDYVSGTDLINATTSALFGTIQPTSVITVTLGGIPSIGVLLDVNLVSSGGTTVSGSGGLGDFYGTQNPGIVLNDCCGVTGAIQGQFVGPAMEGAISTIKISDSGGGVGIGTAAFQRGPFIAP